MLTPVRVQEVVLDHYSNNYCGEHSIGTIIYSELNQTVIYQEVQSPLRARPLNPNYKQYPVPQEIVFLLPGPKDTYMSEGGFEPYYLTGPLNLHNNPSINSLPTTLDEEGRHYEGEYFEGDRLAKIRPLRPYEGDVTMEGRYGQSIRFGSTTDVDKGADNFWSQIGQLGDPITIIRNGQKKETDSENFHLIEEDINNDHSSIYLCSNQQMVGFKPASYYDASYGKDIFENIIGEEITHSNEDLESNVEEDITLNTADDLPASELMQNDELAQLTSSEIATYDQAPTDDQAISTVSDSTLSSNNVIPNSVTVNQLEQTLG